MKLTDIENCFVETTQLKYLNDASVLLSSNRMGMKLIRSLVKWPIVFVVYTMFTISVIRKFAVENAPDVY